MALAEEHANRCAQEWEILSDAIFQEALVCEMRQFGIINVEQEGRWITADLCPVVNLQLLASFGGRRMRILRLLQDAIKLGGGYADQSFILDSQCHGQHLGNTLAGFRRDEE